MFVFLSGMQQIASIALKRRFKFRYVHHSDEICLSYLMYFVGNCLTCLQYRVNYRSKICAIRSCSTIFVLYVDFLCVELLGS